MKKPVATKELCPLPRKYLRETERHFGVYLDVPVSPRRTSNQQFAVYDEVEEHVGDICSRAAYFDGEELWTKIKALFTLPVTTPANEDS